MIFYKRDYKEFDGKVLKGFARLKSLTKLEVEDVEVSSSTSLKVRGVEIPYKIVFNIKENSNIIVLDGRYV